MLKKIEKIVLLVLIFAGGFAVGLASKYYIDQWRAQRNVEAWMSALQAPYENDTYGGKTPEETFDLYLAALKKGDLELASKYFVVNRQDDQLQNLKEESDLENYIKELESIDKDKFIKQDVDGQLYITYSAYRYKTRITQVIQIENNEGKIVDKVLPIGAYSSTMVFERNNNVWKIYSL